MSGRKYGANVRVKTIAIALAWLAVLAASLGLGMVLVNPAYSDTQSPQSTLDSTPNHFGIELSDSFKLDDSIVANNHVRTATEFLYSEDTISAKINE